MATYKEIKEIEYGIEKVVAGVLDEIANNGKWDDMQMRVILDTFSDAFEKLKEADKTK